MGVTEEAARQYAGAGARQGFRGSIGTHPESISLNMVRFQGYIFCNYSFISCIIKEMEQNT